MALYESTPEALKVAAKRQREADREAKEAERVAKAAERAAKAEAKEAEARAKDEARAAKEAMREESSRAKAEAAAARAEAAAARAAERGPRPARTAYQYYAEEHRALASQAQPEVGGGELGKVLRAEFKALSSEERAPYEAKAAADKERYEAECAATGFDPNAAAAAAAKRQKTAPCEGEAVEGGAAGAAGAVSWGGVQPGATPGALIDATSGGGAACGSGVVTDARRSSLPPGWSAEKREAKAGPYTIYHGPNGHTVRSIVQAWKLYSGEGEGAPTPFAPPGPVPFIAPDSAGAAAAVTPAAATAATDLDAVVAIGESAAGAAAGLKAKRPAAAWSAYQYYAEAMRGALAIARGTRRPLVTRLAPAAPAPPPPPRLA